MAKATPRQSLTMDDAIVSSFDSATNTIAVSSGISTSRTSKGNQKTTITSSTAETTIVTAGGSGVYLDIYGLIFANTSATACNVTIKDDTSGTTRFIFAVPAGDTRGFMVNPDGAHLQAVANKPWSATCSASVASIEITALFIKNT